VHFAHRAWPQLNSGQASVNWDRSEC
jgi:hypothetical protein